MVKFVSRSMVRSALAAVLVLVGAPSARADAVLDKLAALPGVSVQETTIPDDTLQGQRRFVLQIEQPVDHFDATAGKFHQKLVLFHRDFSEPMVLQTSGYSIFSEKLSRIAATFKTNQIQVEHRYFSTSSPEPKDWSKLTVRQSAEDFHLIVQTFRALYGARWVNTGASKGGMTSIFFRRYYPKDLDGTVADVAPLSFTTDDPRYIPFIDQVGGAEFADCRVKLEVLQRALLTRRQEILPTFDGKFTQLGGKGVALEHATIEMPFAFWQYGNPEDPAFGCAKVPTATAPASELAAFLNQINDPAGLTDDGIAGFQPYFYQSAAELGAPASKLSQLQGLLQFPYNLEQYLPNHTPVAYTDVTMLDIKSWVANQADGMMFVYGEFDPWSAGAYTDIHSGAGIDNHWYQVPRFNHGSNFTKLPDALKKDSIEVLGRWLNKAAQPISNVQGPAFSNAQESLEDAELRFLREHHIR